MDVAEESCRINFAMRVQSLFASQAFTTRLHYKLLLPRVGSAPKDALFLEGHWRAVKEL